MMNKKEWKYGVLIYVCEINRLSVKYDVDSYHYGLHCGNCLEIKIKGKWIETRVEMNQHGWYLVGLKEYHIDHLLHLRVRISY